MFKKCDQLRPPLYGCMIIPSGILVISYKLSTYLIDKIGDYSSKIGEGAQNANFGAGWGDPHKACLP